ncbi:unnamed protein product [Caenorhabditis brenneri]
MFYSLILLTSLFTIINSAPTANSTNGDVSQCLKSFYRSAYDNEYNEYNCTKDIPLFSENFFTQKTSFVTGKNCFLEFAKEECSIAQYNLLNTRYEEFLDVITKAPLGGKVPCSHPYFRYNALRCEPIIEDFSTKGYLATNTDTKMNDSRVLEAIDVCQRVVNCISQPCYYTEQIVEQFKEDCKLLELQNSFLMDCNNKLKRESPDLSGYPCLGGISFNYGEKEDGIELLSTKRECTKKVMKDFCGEKVLENFDEMAERLLNNLRITAKVRDIVFYQEEE